MQIIVYFSRSFAVHRCDKCDRPPISTSTPAKTTQKLPESTGMNPKQYSVSGGEDAKNTWTKIPGLLPVGVPVHSHRTLSQDKNTSFFSIQISACVFHTIVSQECVVRVTTATTSGTATTSNPSLPFVCSYYLPSMTCQPTKGK